MKWKPLVYLRMAFVVVVEAVVAVHLRSQEWFDHSYRLFRPQELEVLQLYLHQKAGNRTCLLHTQQHGPIVKILSALTKLSRHVN